MGVDFYVCHSCGGTICDCGDYVICDCGKHWCDDECAEEDGYDEERCTQGFEDSDDCDEDCECWNCDYNIETSCEYCFDDEEIMAYMFKKFNITRGSLVAEIKSQKGEK